MINWTIKIQSPLLALGMSFQVKYRKLPSTNWVSFSPNPTTNEFTIPNLENGDYEAEIRTICTNGELSGPVYHSNAGGQTCPIVTDLTYTENIVDPTSYQHRSLNFNWSRQIGLMYRLEFQNGGVGAGFNDSETGINSNTPVTIVGLIIDKVRVITICQSGDVNSEWIDIAAAEPPTYPVEPFYYKSPYRDDQPGQSVVTYKDEYGVTQQEILPRAFFDGAEWIYPACTEIIAYQIINYHLCVEC